MSNNKKNILVYSMEELLLPSSIQDRIHSFGFSFSNIGKYISSSGSLFFTEVLFMYCHPRQNWRFMGASVNYLDRDNFDGVHTEELASSIFREDPTEDIDAPWSCILAFCETALCSKMGRIVSPFVRLAHEPHCEGSILVPLRSFDYHSMTWMEDVSPFSKPA